MAILLLAWLAGAEWLIRISSRPHFAGVECLSADQQGVAENDARRASLERFIRSRWEAGDNEAELLVVEGLKHLKKLDGASDE